MRLSPLGLGCRHQASASSDAAVSNRRRVCVSEALVESCDAQDEVFVPQYGFAGRQRGTAEGGDRSLMRDASQSAGCHTGGATPGLQTLRLSEVHAAEDCSRVRRLGNTSLEKRITIAVAAAAPAVPRPDCAAFRLSKSMSTSPATDCGMSGTEEPPAIVGRQVPFRKCISATFSSPSTQCPMDRLVLRSVKVHDPIARQRPWDERAPEAACAYLTSPSRCCCPPGDASLNILLHLRGGIL